MDSRKYFDMENEYKEWEVFIPTKQNVKDQKGRFVLFVKYVDPYRGYYSIESGVLEERLYSTLHLDNYGQQVDTRDLRAMIIKKILPEEG